MSNQISEHGRYQYRSPHVHDSRFVLQKNKWERKRGYKKTLQEWEGRNQYFDQFDSDEDDSSDNASFSQEENKITNRIDGNHAKSIIR